MEGRQEEEPANSIRFKSIIQNTVMALGLLPPTGFFIYGDILAFAEGLGWGMAVLVLGIPLFPVMCVAGWVEVLTDWQFVIPLWPYAYGGVWLALGATFAAWVAERERK